ncbi:hypothetical protein [Sphingomonas sp. T9W2]|uniref:hypothetical protein n=1 Tax=Sphingomonas sp. T9W2 TaxID=3143183 RepID=UPI0031F5AF26
MSGTGSGEARAASPVERRPFGPTGRPVAAIGQGSWCIDDADRPPPAVAALRHSLDLGMNYIDTAEQ